MKKIIIVGGGFAGSLIARKLENKFDVTLIDTKDYFEYTPEILKAIVSPKKAKKIQVLHKSYLNRAQFIHGYAKSVDKKSVFVNNKKIPYDYLVICTGSEYTSPIKQTGIILADHIKHLQNKNKEYQEAKRILIIGGGLVGVELAGEICTNHDKGVTIINKGNRLLERTPKKASKYAQRFLEKRGVRVILGESFLKKEGDYYLTNKKTRLRADLLFACTGIHPNSQFMLKNFRKLVNKKHQIVVNKFLNAKGSKNIFVVGDVNDINIEKTAQNAEIQARIAIKNINALENNKRLREYRPRVTPLVISLRNKKGIFVWKNFVLKGFLPAIMKSLIEFFYMAKYKKSQ